MISHVPCGTSRISPIRSLVRRAAARCNIGLTFALLATAGVFVDASASTAAAPVISIQADDAMLAPLTATPVYTWRAAVGRPLEFVASITRADVSPVDVYLAVVVPDGRLLSWVRGSANVPVLVAGLAPAQRGVTANSISGATLLGSNPQYLFSAVDALGLYSLTAILVAAGGDPSDPRNWIAAVMAPLLISD